MDELIIEANMPNLSEVEYNRLKLATEKVLELDARLPEMERMRTYSRSMLNVAEQDITRLKDKLKRVELNYELYRRFTEQYYVPAPAILVHLEIPKCLKPFDAVRFAGESC